MREARQARLLILVGHKRTVSSSKKITGGTFEINDSSGYRGLRIFNISRVVRLLAILDHVIA